MQLLFKQFSIFKQIDQINLQEYCFYAQDQEQHLCFIHIDGGSVEIEITQFELQQLIKLSSYKVQCLNNFNQRLQQIFSEIKPIDEQEIFCSLSLDQLFIDIKTQEIIVPKYILNQIQKSKYRDLFIQNFLKNMMNHVVAKDQIDFFEENKQNIQIMQKIVEQKLDLNDGVSNEIKQLFETFLYVSIEQITQVCLLKNGNYQSSQLDQDQNNYTVVKYLYKTNLLDRKRMPDEDLTKIKGFFQNNLFPKDGNKITNQIIEIQNYHEKKQSGLRLTATKMYDVCLYEKWNQDDNFLNEATQYGQEHEKVALEKYASQHPDIKLKFTDVLINLNYPYICGKPDALIYDNHDNLIGIIEVKSPFLKQDLDLNEDENFRLNYIEMNEDKEYILKKNHQYYYQVQVYLLITELPGCIFIVSTKKGNREIIVKKDEALIKQIKKKAEYFYFTQILPNQCQLQKKIIEEEDLIRIKEIERLDRI